MVMQPGQNPLCGFADVDRPLLTMQKLSKEDFVWSFFFAIRGIFFNVSYCPTESLNLANYLKNTLTIFVLSLQHITI